MVNEDGRFINLYLLKDEAPAMEKESCKEEAKAEEKEEKVVEEQDASEPTYSSEVPDEVEEQEEPHCKEIEIKQPL